jgi:hypothetical protein
MRLNVRRWATGLIALTAFTLLPLACSPKPESTDNTAATAPVEEQALVRFVNATSYKEPVDLYLDEAKVLPEVMKDKVTDYSEWAPERHQIELRVAGTSTPAATNSESLSSGERYTVVGFSRMDGTPAVAVFRDSASEPEAGKARIRLIHVADGAAELGVYPSGAKDSLVDGVNYSDESSADVDPGVRALEIRKDGEKVVALKIPELSLEAGKVYTFVVAADQDRKLRAIQLEGGATPTKQFHR